MSDKKRYVEADKLEEVVHAFFEKDDTYYATERNMMDLIEPLAVEVEPGAITELIDTFDADTDYSIDSNVFERRCKKRDKARIELAALVKERDTLKKKLAKYERHESIMSALDDE